MCDKLIEEIEDDLYAKEVVFHPAFAYPLFKNKFNILKTKLLCIYVVVNQDNQVSFYIAEKAWLVNPDIVYLNIKIPEREYLLKVAEYTESKHLVNCPTRTTLRRYEHR